MTREEFLKRMSQECEYPMGQAIADYIDSKLPPELKPDDYSINTKRLASDLVVEVMKGVSVPEMAHKIECLIQLSVARKDNHIKSLQAEIDRMRKIVDEVNKDQPYAKLSQIRAILSK